MPDIEFWIQLENRAWDVAPHNIDRLTGRTMAQIPGGGAPVAKTITSPETGVTRTRTMFKPLGEDALILRRYKPNWAAPDDRKVNPWDINELDPTDNGTMGTIPGPVIECKVGDRVIVHFRNKDFRAGKASKARAHSLHPHGFVFDPKYDGAFPLAPPDPTQPVGGEAALWAQVGVTGNKKADRVPPGGTFTYFWNTFRWPTTAGVWLYHDHSFCDMENVMLGAIGIIVIHNEQDPDDVIQQDLPGGQPNGSLFKFRCFPFPFEKLQPFPFDFEGLGLAHVDPIELENVEHTAMDMGGEKDEKDKKDEKKEHAQPKGRGAKVDKEAPVFERAVRRGDLILEFDPKLDVIARLCLRFYVEPPKNALYLQLYHELSGTGMTINGRKYLGNTPTLLAGLQSKMKFGVVGMNDLMFHTFHLHGHRWTIPGPDGNNPGAIQGSPQVTAVSQFEDTRIFGPANSFGFTINQGSFMGSLRPPDATSLGEWHMHCHVLNHMDDGMMGSLLIVQAGQFAFALPRGEPCPEEVVPATVVVKNFAFTPNFVEVSSGGTLTFDFQETPHTVKTVSTTMGAPPITINNGGGDFDAVSPVPQLKTVTVNGMAGAEINYECGIHGAGMSGKIKIV
jgi:FtsP/CotA-like multicopper oxidase with cupredoxin domain